MTIHCVSRRPHLAVLVLVIFAGLIHYIFWHIIDDASLSNTNTLKGEQIETYTLPQHVQLEKVPHLTPIDPNLLILSGTHSIDIAHRNGYLHTGHCLYIMDADGLLLFLKRSPFVVTCPNTWSILGEHSIANEAAYDTVVRGMEEELGLKQLKQVETATNYHDDGQEEVKSIFSTKLQTIDKETIEVTIQNITEYPLYYIRHYGPRLDNRIDSQLTYLWLVRLPRRHYEIRIQLDHEVADHKWISLDEFSDWIEADARRDDEENIDFDKKEVNEGNERDDGPPSGDFCHHTIRSLYSAGLENLKLLLL